jgi:hypothetical protein
MQNGKIILEDPWHKAETSRGVARWRSPAFLATKFNSICWPIPFSPVMCSPQHTKI